MPSTAADRGGRDRLEPAADRGRPPVFVAARELLARDQVILDGSEGRHAATVRRLRPGERADLIDGAGLVAECVVASARPGELELTVLTRREEPPPQPRICVIQAIPKGDRGEQAVETMTEVGVDVIVPWAAERCVAVWDSRGSAPGAGPGTASRGGGRRQSGGGDREPRGLARWRRTALEASKQSRRTWFPEVTALASTADAVGRARAAACPVVLDPAGPARLGTLELPVTGEILLVVGPEGGLTAAESAAFAQAGATAAHLGPTVLRASTAGTAAAAVLLSRCGRW